MRVRNIPFKLERVLVSSVYRSLGSRPPSYPYLSGDGFRLVCPHRYEDGAESAFEPRAIAPYETVFCDAWRLKDFLQGPARSIERPFSIVSHNGDPNIDESILPLLPPSLWRLFGQNVLAEDPRLVPLPIGLENKWLHCNGIVGDYRRLRRGRAEKRARILTAFTIGTNETIRRPIIDQLSKSRFADRVSRMNARAYRKLAINYMFIASPPGNGADCHRTWEAMYLRSIPIVLRSTMTESFAALGLPLCLVNSFDEVAAWGETELVSLYDRLSPGFESEALWFGFWERKIRQESASGGLSC